MQPIDTYEVLATVPLFAEVLDERQLAGLAARCHLAAFPAGSILMAEGDFGTSMFVIAEGVVEVTVAGKRGEPHEVAELGPGEIVGEMSLMTGARRNATATALGDVVAAEITKVALEAILARAPDLIDSFGAVLVRRQAERDRVARDAAHGGIHDLVSQIRRFFGGA